MKKKLEWVLANLATGRPLNEHRYLSEGEACIDLARLGEVLERMYGAVPDYQDQHWRSVLVEGLRPGDLEGILLPQLSIDVYVPGDADTDNIVVGFLIKGVPEAVFPFKNFCAFTRGVTHVDYGDSDTMPHTSIVYVEFDREQFDIQNFANLIDGICRLSKLDEKDLSVNFPNSNKVFPYTIEVVERYFNRRNVDRNRLEQWKANHERAKQIQKEIEHEMEQGEIGKRLGGNNTPAEPNDSNGFKRLKKPETGVRGIKQKKPGAIPDIPETIKASIRAEAQRNRTNHQTPWKDFDNRWSQRLRVLPSRIASIRKQIYKG